MHPVIPDETVWKRCYIDGIKVWIPTIKAFVTVMEQHRKRVEGGTHIVSTSDPLSHLQPGGFREDVSSWVKGAPRHGKVLSVSLASHSRGNKTLLVTRHRGGRGRIRGRVTLKPDPIREKRTDETRHIVTPVTSEITSRGISLSDGREGSGGIPSLAGRDLQGSRYGSYRVTTGDYPVI